MTPIMFFPSRKKETGFPVSVGQVLMSEFHEGGNQSDLFHKTLREVVISQNVESFLEFAYSLRSPGGMGGESGYPYRYMVDIFDELLDREESLNINDPIGVRGKLFSDIVSLCVDAIEPENIPMDVERGMVFRVADVFHGIINLMINNMAELYEYGLDEGKLKVKAISVLNNINDSDEILYIEELLRLGDWNGIHSIDEALILLNSI